MCIAILVVPVCTMKIAGGSEPLNLGEISVYDSQGVELGYNVDFTATLAIQYGGDDIGRCFDADVGTYCHTENGGVIEVLLNDCQPLDNIVVDNRADSNTIRIVGYQMSFYAAGVADAIYSYAFTTDAAAYSIPLTPCDDASDPSEAHLTSYMNACDGTIAGSTCDAYSCSLGYEGGSVTCNEDGTFTVVDCTAITSNCDASPYPPSPSLVISANACDGTPTDSGCSAFTCSDGYAGGSVTCEADSSWTIVDCMGIKN